MKLSWIKIVTIYCLFGLSNDFLKLLAQSPERLENEGAYTPGMPLWFYFYFASVLIGAGALILSKMEAIISLLNTHKVVFFLLFYMLASCVWAINPLLSLSVASKIICATLFGFFLAVRFAAKELLVLLCITMGIIVIGSYFFALFLPEYGIHTAEEHAGKWRGIFTHKNQLAIRMNIGFVAFAMAARHFKKQRLFALGFAFLAATLIILSQSGGGLVILGFILLSPVLLPVLRLHSALCIAVLLTILCILCLLSVLVDLQVLIDQFLFLLGKDPSLSGRTDTWSGILSGLSDYPNDKILAGHGAQGVVFSMHGEVITEQGYKYISIDNAYMNVLIRFGLIGSGLFFLVLAHGFRISIHQLNKDSSVLSNCYIVIMLVMCINGLSENTDQILILWMFLGLIFGSLYSRPHNDAKLVVYHA